MIYSRFGEPIEIVRVATASDVQKHEGRAPTADEIEYMVNKTMLTVRYRDGVEDIALIAFLRADDGLAEIQSAIGSLP